MLTSSRPIATLPTGDDGARRAVEAQPLLRAARRLERGARHRQEPVRRTRRRTVLRAAQPHHRPRRTPQPRRRRQGKPLARCSRCWKRSETPSATSRPTATRANEQFGRASKVGPHGCNRPSERRRTKGQGKGRARGAEPSSHAGWTPASNRPDPVALLEEQNATREPDLVPVRHGRMMVCRSRSIEARPRSWRPISRTRRRQG